MKEKTLHKWSLLVEFLKSSSLAFLALSLSIELINLSLKPSQTQGLALFNNIVFSWILIGIAILYICFLAYSKKLTKADALGILFPDQLSSLINLQSFDKIYDILIEKPHAKKIELMIVLGQG